MFKNISFDEVFLLVGNVIMGLAIAGCVVSCLQVWRLTRKVEELEKKINQKEEQEA